MLKEAPTPPLASYYGVYITTNRLPNCKYLNHRNCYTPSRLLISFGKNSPLTLPHFEQAKTGIGIYAG